MSTNEQSSGEIVASVSIDALPIPDDEWTRAALARGMPLAVARRLPHLPESPGVYLWKDADGGVLYVGKAKRLRSRVRSYWAQDHTTSPKTRGLLRKVQDLDTIVVPSEAHSLILESTLIKEYRPRFNIALRDDKSYPYIKVTVHEPFPRVLVTRRLQDDGARYFGPYTDVGAMRRALNVVKRIFTVRSCHYALPREAPERPCLDYFIKRCKAPCVGYQGTGEYRSMIDEVVWFLEGRTGDVVRHVRERMMEASERLDFERAGELRDALRHLEKMEEPTVVLEVEGGDRDVVGYARDGEDACVVILRIRGGKLLAREHRLLEHAEGEDDGAVLGASLAQWYRMAEARAGDLLVPFDFEDRDVLEASLEGTTIRVPQRGPRRALVDLADKNAQHLLEEFKLASLESEERAADPVYELQRELGLPRLPRSLVCFDISHAQGTDVVASAVWFENARPKRSEYRKFKIQIFEGNDDFKSMHEVVTRYFRRRMDEEKPLPDLAVIDGGKGQLGAAREALTALGVTQMGLISLAKKDEEIFLPGRSESVRLPRRSPALRMLQQARDEAHRFAVTFQRQKRAARTITSELLKIPGIGPTKRRALLHVFGSVQGVKEAALEEIARVPGFGESTARKVLLSLGVDLPLPTAGASGEVSAAPPDDPTPPSTDE
ncbi:excinuclease ABC subunit UvrC [Gemmatimonas phototrophica]|uniref:excinuclease ABC subunit UvrC n=1 Tax=Gemmatimonas phototrophica TaxID=1379270 RepID=UPI0006A6AD51|nr:excinuclease ABC subunit UvrC [Gemmatimonas phototrophica]